MTENKQHLLRMCDMIIATAKRMNVGDNIIVAAELLKEEIESDKTL